ncbi:MFS transporter [Amycolatopsis jejuensis]|uniref:MFS transporter n=1 Tax=Amycolatopsis jejuensis TaxID=330084 RepID=UPI000523F815|nr:MFS transporter [Amycolatopsis jejuensis]
MAAPDAPVPPRTLRRAATASLIGTAIEWYDFFVYGTAAALVFAPQFFPQYSGLAGTLAAFSTFAIGFLARPIGGVVMGHFGDKIGRKSMLVLSLLLMGLATFGIGLLPTYASIGAAAPILLVVLRFVQGLGVGGEWGGAALLAVENAPKHKRGFYGSFPQMGVPIGVILANLVYLIVVGTLGTKQFADWGWRIPFLLSIILVGVGFYVRSRIGETAAFTASRKETPRRGSPVIEVLRRHPKQVLLAGGTFLANNAVGYVIIVYILSYGRTVLKVNDKAMLAVVLVGSVVWLAALPVFSALSDRLGRRTVFVAGGVLSLAWAIPMFALIDTASLPLMLLAVVVMALSLAATYGPQAALFAELFDTEVRYSGASLGYQIGAVLGGGLAPFIATALFASTGSSLATGGYLVGLSAVSLICIALLGETRHRNLHAEEAMENYEKAS